MDSQFMEAASWSPWLRSTRKPRASLCAQAFVSLALLVLGQELEAPKAGRVQDMCMNVLL